MNERTIEWEERLSPDEQLLWTGAPERGLKFKLVDVPLLLFGLFFAGISGGIVASTFPYGLLLPHFWVGLYMAFGRFIVERIIRESTSYAITDQRVVIVRGWPTRKTTDIRADSLGAIELTEHRDGSGTIRFTSVGPRRNGSKKPRQSWTNMSSPGGPAFEYIDQPHHVMALLHAIQQGSPTSSTTTEPSTTPGASAGSSAPAPRPIADPPWPVTYGTPPDPFDRVDAHPPPPPLSTASLPQASATRWPTVAPDADWAPDPVRTEAAGSVENTGSAEPVLDEDAARGPFWRPPA